MATRKVKIENNAYDKIENIVMSRVFMLENENAQLKQDLAIAKAKLEVYERLANISGVKNSIRFWTTNNE